MRVRSQQGNTRQYVSSRASCNDGQTSFIHPWLEVDCRQPHPRYTSNSFKSFLLFPCVYRSPQQEKGAVQEIFHTASFCIAYYTKPNRMERALSKGSGTEVVWQGCSQVSDQGLCFFLLWFRSQDHSWKTVFSSSHHGHCLNRHKNLGRLIYWVVLSGLPLIHQIAPKMPSVFPVSYWRNGRGWSQVIKSMDPGSRDDHTKSERQILYEIHVESKIWHKWAYLWNRTDSQTQRTHLWLPRGCGALEERWIGSLGLADTNLYIEWIKNKVPTV